MGIQYWLKVKIHLTEQLMGPQKTRYMWESSLKKKSKEI